MCPSANEGFGAEHRGVREVALPQPAPATRWRRTRAARSLAPVFALSKSIGFTLCGIVEEPTCLLGRDSEFAEAAY